MYGVDACFVQCLMTLISSDVKDIGIGGIQTNIGDSSPTRARNTLTAQFLTTDCDYMLMLDSDILFNPTQIKRLCSHKELVVGGFYPKKQQGPGGLVINTFSSDLQQPPRADGLQKLRYMGAGCLRISRMVFEMMINKYGKDIAFHPDETDPKTVQYAFWQETPYQYPDGHRRFLTEDWRFCQICLDMGIDVWGDTQVLVEHRGPVVFPLDSQKANIFGLKPTPAANVGLPLPVEPNGAAVLTLPEGFKVPDEAVDDTKEILAGIYDVPQLKESPRTVLDAGAHVGLFSYWASKRWANATIESYEPVNHESLLANMGGRVKVHKAALSNHNNELKLRKGINSLRHSINPRYAGGEEFTVPCKDAKDIGRFEFVKVDTEGSEVDIISTLDLTETKALVCETHCDNDRIAIRQYMERSGFVTLYDEVTLNDCRLIKFARPEALKA